MASINKLKKPLILGIALLAFLSGQASVIKASTDGWQAMSTNVEQFWGGPAVWTGNEMIVWGGQDASNQVKNTGARYNSSTNTWTPTSTVNAPAARRGHTAVWTGT